VIPIAFAALLAQAGSAILGGPDIVLQSGHTANISALAFSPDGKFLVSASEDSTLKLWNPNTGAEIRTLHGHSNIVTALAVSADSSKIISASLDHTLRVWNAATGEQDALLHGALPSVYLLKITPDSSSLITAETVATGTILRIWDIKSARQIRLIRRDDAAVSNIFFSGFNMLVAEESGDEDSTGSLTAYSLRTGKQMQTRPALLCGASDDGKWIVLDQSTEKQRRALIVDVVHDKPLVSFSGQVSRVMFSSSGEWLAYESISGDSAVIRRTQGGGARIVHGHGAEFSMLALSPDGRLLATAGADFSIHIWDVESGKLAHAMSGQYTPSAIAFSPDGRRIAVNGGGPDLGSALQVWDIERKTQVAAPQLKRPAAGLSFSRDGAYLAVSVPSLEIFDTRSMSSLQKLNCASETAFSPVFSPNGKLVAANCGGSITVWSVDGGAEPFHFGEASDPGNGPLLFSPDGRLLAAASSMALVIYDNAAHKILQTVRVAGAISALAFSPDSERLACGMRLNPPPSDPSKPDMNPLSAPVPSHSLFLMDMRTRRKLWSAPAGQWISALKFAREGRTLVVAAGDELHKAGSITLFDAASGRPLRKLSARIPDSPGAAFSPNGEWFAAGWNSATWLWRVPLN
jgi:WD40 repeat protein